MIVIADYDAGNLTSVRRALEYLGERCIISGDPDTLLSADKLIVPGVGDAAAAVRSMRASGVFGALRGAAARGVPIFGICLGMQLFMEHSDEGDVECLGFFKGGVTRLEVPARSFKIPHMGWNALWFPKERTYTRAADGAPLNKHPLFAGVKYSAQFYFVHSFRAAPADKTDVIAYAHHGQSFPAVIGRGNVFATQFHPEKSGREGLRLLQNFCRTEFRR
jgi:glutamine amidotransferase